MTSPKATLPAELIDCPQMWAEEFRHFDVVAFSAILPIYNLEPLDLWIFGRLSYEVFVDGECVGLGPCLCPDGLHRVDHFIWNPPLLVSEANILILVYGTHLEHLHYAGKPNAFISGFFRHAEQTWMLDESWVAIPMPMWDQESPRLNFQQDPLEFYQGDREPDGWRKRRFSKETLKAAPSAQRIESSGIYELKPRETPIPELYFRKALKIFQATDPAQKGEGSWETLPAILSDAVRIRTENKEGSCALMAGEAILVDLGGRFVGHPAIDFRSSSSASLEIGWAERLDDEGKPVFLSKGTSYVARAQFPIGKHTWRTWHWTGARFIVIRNLGPGNLTDLIPGFIERKVERSLSLATEHDQPAWKDIVSISANTVSRCSADWLTDCPTREKAHYFGDGYFHTFAMADGFKEEGWINWYLDCFLNAYRFEDGQISNVTPGRHLSLIDYSLVPSFAALSQHRRKGQLKNAVQLCTRFKELDDWYRRLLDPKTDLLRFADPLEKRGPSHSFLFLDHHGIGWHDIPGPPLIRGEISSVFNLYYLGFLKSWAELSSNPNEKSNLTERIQLQSTQIRSHFLRNGWIDDALSDGKLSGSSSWHANASAVFFGLLTFSESRELFRKLVNSSEERALPTPGFLFYVLGAFIKTGLIEEGQAFTIQMFQKMLDEKTDTTWETFDGLDKDSLCHPWGGAAVLLFAAASKDPAHWLHHLFPLARKAFTN